MMLAYEDDKDLTDAEIREAFSEMGMLRMSEDWSHPLDACYDNWKELYCHLIPRTKNQQLTTDN
jgi:hypothetical protein